MNYSMTKYIPEKLFIFCSGLVMKTHEQFGYLNLPKHIVQKEYMFMLVTINDTYKVMKSANSSFKIKNVLFFLFIVMLVLSWLISWWILLSELLIILIIVKLRNTEKSSYMYLSSFLLSLEMIVNDFANLGSKYPKQMKEALQLMTDSECKNKTYWLDFYLPRRNELSLEVLERWGTI